MSTPDWSSEDLKLFSRICERIFGYHDRLEPHLQSLPHKFQKLGKKLNDSSRFLKESSTLYHDPNLDKHLQNVDLELQNQSPTNSAARTGLTTWIPGRRRNNNNELTTKRIIQLHLEVDAHIDIAEKFRTEFLFNHAYPKLQYILEELRQQVQRGNGSLSREDPNIVSANERDCTTHSTQSSSSALLPIDNRDVKTLAWAPGAINMARIVWNSRADALDHDRRRSRRNYSSRTDPTIVRKDENLRAKEKFLNDVLSLIDETQLDELGVSDGGPSRVILDRLAGIVAQATELNKKLSSPEIGILQSSTLSSPVTGPATINERIPIPTPPKTTSSSSSPQTVGQSHKISRKPVPQPQPRNPISPADSGGIAPVDDAAGRIGLNGSQQEFDHPGPWSSSEFPSIGSPAITSSDSGSPVATGDEIPSTYKSAVAIGKQPARTKPAARDKSSNPSSWTKISCLEAGLMPSFCTLEFISWKDKQFLRVIVFTDFVQAPLIGGSAQRASPYISSTSDIDHSGRTHALSNARTFEHLILPDARPMPSVMYPDYEGTSYRPDTPYKIKFTEEQSLCEHTANPRPQFVRDLEYTFSDKAERDRIRSRLFGKRLLLHAGVQRIEFDYIACLLSAVSLWEEAANKPLTFTFNRNSTASRSRPHGEVEYEITGLVSRGNRREANEPLTLEVRQVAGPGIGESLSKKKDCRLFFSRNEDRADFISFLNPPPIKPG